MCWSWTKSFNPRLHCIFIDFQHPVFVEIKSKIAQGLSWINLRVSDEKIFGLFAHPHLHSPTRLIPTRKSGWDRERIPQVGESQYKALQCLLKGNPSNLDYYDGITETKRNHIPLKLAIVSVKWCFYLPLAFVHNNFQKHWGKQCTRTFFWKNPVRDSRLELVSMYWRSDVLMLRWRMLCWCVWYWCVDVRCADVLMCVTGLCVNN